MNGRLLTKLLKKLTLNYVFWTYKMGDWWMEGSGVVQDGYGGKGSERGRWRMGLKRVKDGWIGEVDGRKAEDVRWR